MTRFAAGLSALVMLGSSAWAADQGYFRVNYTIDRSGPKEIRLVGTVHNDAWLDVKDVRLRVQALDAAGKVIAEPQAYVDQTIRGKGDGYWEASLPPDPRISRFRVYVVGYRYQQVTR